MIILKFTDKQGFTLSLEDTFFEKPRKEKQDFTLSLEYTTRGGGGMGGGGRTEMYNINGFSLANAGKQVVIVYIETAGHKE